MWMTNFGGDTTIAGRTAAIDGKTIEILGVMPRDFDFGSTSVGLWMPLRLGDETHRMRRTERYLHVLGRMRPGISHNVAQDEMTALAGRLSGDYPEANTGVGARVVLLQEDFVGALRPSLTTLLGAVLLGAVAFVLVIACCNFANLLLFRTTSRQREIAIRRAMGARRLRIVRQWLTETAL
jgi:hypothetical protein